MLYLSLITFFNILVKHRWIPLYIRDSEETWGKGQEKRRRWRRSTGCHICQGQTSDDQINTLLERIRKKLRIHIRTATKQNKMDTHKRKIHNTQKHYKKKKRRSRSTRKNHDNIRSIRKSPHLTLTSSGASKASRVILYLLIRWTRLAFHFTRVRRGHN